MRRKEQRSVIRFNHNFSIHFLLVVIFCCAQPGRSVFSRGFFFNNKYVPIPPANVSLGSLRLQENASASQSWSSVGLIKGHQSSERSSSNEDQVTNVNLDWSGDDDQEEDEDYYSLANGKEEKQDAVNLVKDLEHDTEKKDELFPEVMQFLQGALTTKTRPLAHSAADLNTNSTDLKPENNKFSLKPQYSDHDRTDLPVISSTHSSTVTEINLFSGSDESEIEDDVSAEDDALISIANKELEENEEKNDNLPENLDNITEDIVDDIEAGVEVSLRISGE